ncbi:eukaryotic translation initiation factor 4B isoform X1 [Neodiprion virginianus]|uniref:eukaryotic translation initiation factor 4B isoform X1 n=1 Tax=Neodiprion fabricii TaxID=2872261 RepID=UPI001ED8C89D|nr:eukaryotic translation initiation factor 4B isoform X1 [Neodiprion fabricii]XP_046629733.1 eukaryotic translation initiation factor 4B isoform X1 [Neodiprion virginianus]
MSSGKKTKKSKGKTLALTDFLADTPGGIPTAPLKTSNWADDVEDEHEGFSSNRSKEPVYLPTAPRAARGTGVNEENIPTNPPYVAYISNLPYDIDEEDLAEFFADMKVSNMRLPKDSNKMRGYGYVEFEDRQSLIDALSIANTTIKTRRVRIEVSNSSSDDRRGGGRMGRDNRRDTYDDPERTAGDWRSGPRDDSAPGESDRYRSRGGFDNKDRRDDREGSDDNKPGGWREGGDRGGDRGGAFRDRGGFRDEGDRERDRPRYGGDRDNRDRDGDRDRDRGSSFGPRRTYGDSDWGRDGSSRREEPRSELKTRPKLQLQPRTKPVEPIIIQDEPVAEESVAEEPVVAPPAPVPAVNIFGAAKPVDTAAKEREIEERLARSNAEAKPKEEGEQDKRPAKDGVWGRRNGEGREEKDKERQGWRSEQDRGRQIERSGPRSQAASARSGQRGDSRGPLPSRGGPVRGPPKSIETRSFPDRERREKDRDEDMNRMPKAKEEQIPNFAASNKYSILPDDVDQDIIDD